MAGHLMIAEAQSAKWRLSLKHPGGTRKCAGVSACKRKAGMGEPGDGAEAALQLLNPDQVARSRLYDCPLPPGSLPLSSVTSALTRLVCVYLALTTIPELRVSNEANREEKCSVVAMDTSLDGFRKRLNKFMEESSIPTHSRECRTKP